MGRPRGVVEDIGRERGGGDETQGVLGDILVVAAADIVRQLCECLGHGIKSSTCRLMLPMGF